MTVQYGILGLSWGERGVSVREAEPILAIHYFTLYFLGSSILLPKLLPLFPLSSPPSPM